MLARRCGTLNNHDMPFENACGTWRGTMAYKAPQGLIQPHGADWNLVRLFQSHMSFHETSKYLITSFKAIEARTRPYESCEAVRHCHPLQGLSTSHHLL